jgi:hypothetical protein
MIPFIFYTLMITAHYGQFVSGNNNFSVIGLPVLPFFGLMIAQGIRFTHDPLSYFLRIMFLAVLSEVPYNVLTGHEFNDITGLLFGLSIVFIYSSSVKKGSKILTYPFVIYLLNAIDFKLAYICFWVLLGDVLLDYKDIRISRIFKRSYLNYLIYPVHLLILIGIREIF